MPKAGTIPVPLSWTPRHKVPCLGILTADGQPQFRGNRSNFIDIARAGEHRGVAVLVITPRQLLQKSPYGWTRGYCLHPQARSWSPTLWPLPRVIYNRLPTRKIEQHPRSRRVLQYLQQLPGIYLFNPSFFDKWSIYQHLFASPHLGKLVPETSPLSWAELRRMIEKYPKLYIKPAEGRAGIHLMRIRVMPQGHYELIHQLRQRPQRQEIHSFGALWQEIRQQQRWGPYLLQQGIELARYRGRSFDIRTLVQKGGRGRWVVTGSGVRVAGHTAISTHVPRGGSIAPLRPVFEATFGRRTPQIRNKIRKTALAIAHYLSQNLPHLPTHDSILLAEMSIDWGIDREGNLWFFEANAKPMKFDEPKIRARSLHNLIAYTIYLNQQLSTPGEEPCG